MGMGKAATKVSLMKFLFSNLPHFRSPKSSNHHHLTTTIIRHFGGGGCGGWSDHDDGSRRRDTRGGGRGDPPNPIPNRPLRGNRPNRDERDSLPSPSPLSFKGPRNDSNSYPNRPPREGGRGRKEGRPDNGHLFSSKLDFGNDDDDNDDNTMEHQSSPFLGSSTKSTTRDVDGAGEIFLEKFKLGFEGKEEQNPQQDAPTQVTQSEPLPPPPQDADDIFKKMKETGLIPNAVAMLDGLCKDGLVQDAMKLFGLMREKGTIPEVVIYTAVVEGFCKAHKFDDAKRIFRKMQTNGITPNAFSYTVLIQGHSNGRSLEDAVDFSIEMLEAGHSPNVATFVKLIDALCKDKGVDEAESIVRRLREKGYFVNEKAVREHLDKKGRFSPLVWEAIFGKKSSQKLF